MIFSYYKNLSASQKRIYSRSAFYKRESSLFHQLAAEKRLPADTE